MKIQIKRVYDEPSAADGTRILIDRLWPRGLSKAKAHVDLWLKDIAPTTPLRQWFGHDPGKWPEFKPTVSPLLTPVTSRNILLLPSLPNSIPYRQDNVRRRKDAHRVGTAARGNIGRLSRLPRRLHSDGGSSGRVRHALSTRSGDRGQRAPRAPLPPGVTIPSG